MLGTFCRNRFASTTILIFALVSISCDVFGGDWEKVKETDGITVYSREVPGSPVLAFKGNGVVNAPIAKVASAIFDPARAREWVENLEETRRVRWLSADQFLQYDHIGTPIVMKDRDFVSTVKMKVEPARQRVVFEYHSTTDPELPETKYVRGELTSSLFVLTSIDNGTKTNIEGEIHADPKGSVAKWIVNFFQKQWPVTTLNSLRKQVTKADIKLDPHFAALAN
ncbi:MAG: hypothetical protein HY074_00470 [Deltaproteobacteria bacterium]|nr:hypothetical protein [Deltaproteobacteria bacterium]